MYDVLFKSIIKLKLKAADAVIDCLPEEAQKPASNLRESFLKAASEALSEHMDKVDDEKNADRHKVFEKISID